MTNLCLPISNVDDSATFVNDTTNTGEKCGAIEDDLNEK